MGVCVGGQAAGGRCKRAGAITERRGEGCDAEYGYTLEGRWLAVPGLRKCPGRQGEPPGRPTRATRAPSAPRPRPIRKQRLGVAEAQ